MYVTKDRTVLATRPGARKPDDVRAFFVQHPTFGEVLTIDGTAKGAKPAGTIYFDARDNPCFTPDAGIDTGDWSQWKNIYD